MFLIQRRPFFSWVSYKRGSTVVSSGSKLGCTRHRHKNDSFATLCAHPKRAESVVHVVLPLKEEWVELGPWAGLGPWVVQVLWVASEPWVGLEG